MKTIKHLLEYLKHLTKHLINQPRSVQSHWKPNKSHENLTKPIETQWNLIKPIKTEWNQVKPSQTEYKNRRESIRLGS